MKSKVLFADMPSSHVLVTGGTGFIGELLVNSLLSSFHRITVLTRNREIVLKMFAGKVVAITQFDEIIEPVDVVINLAGARILGWRWTPKRREVLRNSRINLTGKLVAWVAQAAHKPKIVLSASAIGFYGIQPLGDNRELAENSPSQPIFMAELCADWEASARQLLPLGIAVGIMRFGLVLGEGGALPMMLLPVKLGLAGPLGSGRQWLSWIHVEDLLRAMAHIWRVLQQEQADSLGVFNFTAPEAVSQLDFHRAAAQLLSRPCIWPTPAWLMRLLLGEQADLLVEGQRVVPAALINSGFKFQYPNIKEALANLLQR